MTFIAIIMLTLFHKQYSIIQPKTLMSFNHSYNQVSKKQLRDFFKNLNIKDFVFYSKRFNKTVMTFMYYIANLSGDAKALLYAQELRSHVSSSSTLHYLDLNTRAVETLSRQLFARGEFGHVATLLLQKINGYEVGSFSDVTEQVCRLNETFGNATKINATVGFLNTVKGDKDSVLELLDTKSFAECQELLTDLFAKKLPSKEGSDIQCLHSKKGCQKPNLTSCFECPFHIPTIYTLSALCDGILFDMQLYDKTLNKANKFKIALRIARKKDSIAQSIKQLGRDYVYGCLGMPREDFLDKIIRFNVSINHLFPNIQLKGQ